MSPITSPQRSSLVDQVITALRGQITSGEWPVGTRIPTENELVEQLGVARNTVREAVRSLAHAGLLEIRQGAGTFVRATSELSGVMRRRFAGSGHRDVLELRRALEVEAARLAAERRTSADLGLIDAALRRREHAWASGVTETFVQADAAFHHALLAAAHNTALAELYADLGDVLRGDLREAVGTELTPDRYVDHAPLAAAVRAGDAYAAAREAAAHLGGHAVPGCAPYAGPGFAPDTVAGEDGETATEPATDTAADEDPETADGADADSTAGGAVDIAARTAAYPRG